MHKQSLRTSRPSTEGILLPGSGGASADGEENRKTVPVACLRVVQVDESTCFDIPHLASDTAGGAERSGEGARVDAGPANVVGME